MRELATCSQSQRSERAIQPNMWGGYRREHTFIGGGGGGGILLTLHLQIDIPYSYGLREDKVPILDTFSETAIFFIPGSLPLFTFPQSTTRPQTPKSPKYHTVYRKTARGGLSGEGTVDG